MKSLAIAMLGLLAVSLTACGQSDPEEIAEGGWVYRDSGAIQCESEGLSLTEMRQQLDNAGIEVRDASCGSDGIMRTAVCGAPAGRIGLFEIALADMNAAAELGFEPLDALPEATPTPCPEAQISPR